MATLTAKDVDEDAFYLGICEQNAECSLDRFGCCTPKTLTVQQPCKTEDACPDPPTSRKLAGLPP